MLEVSSNPFLLYHDIYSDTALSYCHCSLLGTVCQQTLNGGNNTNSTNQEPIAVTYSQHHDATQTTDCTQGECHFFENTTHPVGFVGLSSHSTYPFPSYNHVYKQISTRPYDDVYALFLVDRTNYLDEHNKTSFFLPNATNVLRLLSPSEVNETTPVSEYWNGFGGRWGNISAPYLSQISPTCLNDIQTAYEPCPSKEEDPIFYRLMQMIGVYPTDEEVEGLELGNILSAVVDSFVDTNLGQSGPITQLSFQEWTPHSLNAPIWDDVPQNTTEEDMCKTIILRRDPSAETVEYTRWNIKGNILGVISMCIILPVVTSLFLWWLSKILKERPHLIKEVDGEMQPPKRRLKSQIYVLCCAFTLWYAVGRPCSLSTIQVSSFY